jgi:hypothetical protein
MTASGSRAEIIAQEPSTAASGPLAVVNRPALNGTRNESNSSRAERRLYGSGHPDRAEWPNFDSR